MLRSARRGDRRGSVAVEFALVSSFMLLPLFAGGADFVEIISAQAQLNTALQSLYLYAYANPAGASSATAIAAVIAKINAHATHQVSFPATNAGGVTNGTVSYKCMNASGATAAYGAGCASGYTKQSFVSYQLNCSVNITVPLPQGLANPFALSAAGTTQIQ